MGKKSEATKIVAKLHHKTVVKPTGGLTRLLRRLSSVGR